MERPLSTKIAFTSSLVALSVLWAGRASASCDKDTDCKGDRVCNAGQCVSPPPGAAPAMPPAGATPPPYGVQYTPQYQVAPAPPPTIVYAMPPPVQWHYARPGLRRAGIGLFITGAVLDLAGTITYAIGSARDSATCAPGDDQPGNCSGAQKAETIGEVLWGFGGATTVAGIIMWVSGNSVVPGPEPREEAAASPTIRPFVAPTQGGGRAGVTVAF